MRLSILQFIDPGLLNPLPEFSHSLGVAAALLKADGFDVSLITQSAYDAERLRQAIIQQRPQYILADLSPCNVTPARRAIADISSQFSLPVAVVGTFATCRASRAISMPGVTALLPGEFEEAALEFFRAVRDHQDPTGLEGVWINSDTGVVKGLSRPLVADLDSLPAPDRELFDYARIVAATGEAAFKTSRGCSMWCGCCINDWYMDLYDGQEPYLRRRSVERVLNEIAAVTGAYPGVASLRFYDHAFAMDADWLSRFATAYKARFTLPYRCHVRLDKVTPEIAQRLASSGCRWVSTRLGSGSRFIREEVQSLHGTDAQIIEACRVLRRAGLSIEAEVTVGNPYETPIAAEDTLRLLAAADVHKVIPRVFYPVPGTRAAEMCEENGWISGRGEENYWTNRSVLNMPSMPADQIDQLFIKFPLLLKRYQKSGLRRFFDRLLPEPPAKDRALRSPDAVR